MFFDIGRVLVKCTWENFTLKTPVMKRIEVQEEKKLPGELISSLMQCLSYPEEWVLSKCHGNYNYITKNLQYAKTQNFQWPSGSLNNIATFCLNTWATGTGHLLYNAQLFLLFVCI